MIVHWLGETSVKNIIPLAMLRSRLSTLSTYWMSLSYCAGHRMGRWSYRGFMRWCTPDGSASGWVEGLQARWGVWKLDASWLQAFYDFRHTYENGHFSPHRYLYSSCTTPSCYFSLFQFFKLHIKSQNMSSNTPGDPRKIHSFLSKCWSSYLTPPHLHPPLSFLAFPSLWSVNCLLYA